MEDTSDVDALSVECTDIGDMECSPPCGVFRWMTGVVGQVRLDMGVWKEEAMGFSSTFTLLIYILWAEFEALNSPMASSTKTLLLLTQWFSEFGYPFHLIRYWSLCPWPNLCELRTFSTSFSSCPSSISSGGHV